MYEFGNLFWRWCVEQTIEDYADDLWTVFNVVQEKLIRGGIKLPTNRHSRPINNFVNDNTINTKLWELAEQYI